MLASEWQDVYAILMQRIKVRDMYPAWRQEEQTAQVLVLGSPWTSIETSPDHFVERSTQDGTLAWAPKPWRTDWAARVRWSDTWNARARQDQALIDACASAVAATEQALLAGLRDDVIATAQLPNSPTPDGTRYLSDTLQIDVEAGICQMTTRVEQAIETVQGVLFGARYGLLQDATLTVDPFDFDASWQWLGTFDAWQAAMRVFLYPENTLRPTLRDTRSPAFDQLVQGARAAGQLDPESARALASDYSDYFADVTSLGPPALYQSAVPFDGDSAPSAVERYVVALARGGQTGRFYYSTYRLRLQPSQFVGASPIVVGADVVRMWEPAGSIPATGEVVGMLPLQQAEGRQQLGVYALSRVDGEEQVLFTRFDGAAWTDAASTPSVPPLVAAAQQDAARVTPDAAAAATGVATAALQGNEILIVADLDGDNRMEVLAFAAAPDGNGQLRVTVLRGWGAGVAAAWTGLLPAGWQLPPGDPRVVLRSSLSTPPWQADRLLLINNAVAGMPGAEALGVFGWVEGQGFVALSTTTDPGGWPVMLSNTISGAVYPTRFVATNIDGSGPCVVAFEKRDSGHVYSPVKTTATAMRFAGDTLTFVSTADLDFHIDADQSTATQSESFDIEWQGFLSVQSGFGPSGYEGNVRCDIVVTCLRSERTQAYVGHQHYQTVHYLELLRWDRTLLRFRTKSGELPPGAAYTVSIPGASGQSDWTLDAATDELFVVTPPHGPGTPALLIRNLTAGHEAIATLRYRPNGLLEVAWQAAGKLAGSGNPAFDWPLRAGDALLVTDIDGDGYSELVLASGDGSRAALVVLDNAGAMAVTWLAQTRVYGADPDDTRRWTLTPPATTRWVAGDLDYDRRSELVLLTTDRRLGVLRSVPLPLHYVPGLPAALQPAGVTSVSITDRYTEAEFATRRGAIQTAYAANASAPLSTYDVYLDEAWYFVPVELGLRLCEAGHHAEALDWFRTVYDYALPPALRKVAGLLTREESLPDQLDRSASWLADTLHPHLIAASRRNSYTRYTLLVIVQCMLEYGDAEFSRNTEESRARARELYTRGLELLESPEFSSDARACMTLLDSLTIRVGDDEIIWLGRQIISSLREVRSLSALQSAVPKLRAILQSDGPVLQRYAEAQAVIAAVRNGWAVAPAFEELLARNQTLQRATLDAVLADAASASAIEQIGLRQTGRRLGKRRDPGGVTPLDPAFGRLVDIDLSGAKDAHRYLPAPSFSFCAPPNPTLDTLRRWAGNNIAKIRTCRDIAVMDTATDGPTRYRFSVLIERAKDLVRLAGQAENTLLAALERRDQEYYNLMRAQQDLDVSRATSQLQVARVKQALTRVDLMGMQLDRARIQSDTYRAWIQAGLNQYEQAMIDSYNKVTQLQTDSATGTLVGKLFGNFGDMAGTLMSSGGDPYSAIAMYLIKGVIAMRDYDSQVQLLNAQNRIQVSAVQASFERKQDEWTLGAALADQDALIAGNEILQAQDEVRLQQQEQAIAGLRLDQADAVVQFLSRKFTGVDLYDWMSGILASVYRYFLQQATSTARAAARQLAFERQQPLTQFIAADYWLPPSSNGQDRMGMTGSARLSEAIVELDQFAFQTDTRRQQMVKVISVAQLDPFAFEQFRRTGVLTFATPMELFDRDFPGHYVRLIHRVRTSVIALIPPVQGIRAVLTNTGLSRVVVSDGSDYRTVVLRREPESVALSSPANASGVFELEAPSPLALPFEWAGVDTAWELRLPRASNAFDYSTLFNVLVGIEYTALDSAAYRRIVARDWSARPLTADRAFGFRQEFADAWYDLHNADPAASQISVSFDTRAVDFPPNVENPTLQRVVLSFALADGRAFAMPVDGLSFTPAGGATIAGGPAQSDLKGTISSRPGGGAPGWAAFAGTGVAGHWELTLPGSQEVRDHFQNEDIDNIVLILTYAGQLPVWPD